MKQSSVEFLDTDTNTEITQKEHVGFDIAQEIENNGTPSVRFYQTPRTIEELLLLKGFSEFLSESFIFIHNKRGLSNHLVKKLKSAVASFCSFKVVQTHITETDNLLDQMGSAQTSDTKFIWIVESSNPTENISTFCAKFQSRERKNGVWILGYVHEINPKILQMFDAIFVFDMSQNEYDILRTVISLPVRAKHELSSSNRGNKNSLLVFIENEFAENVLLAENPIIIHQKKERLAYMDIVPFIPILIEATKFILGEVSNWIDDVRKKSTPDKIEKGTIISLPISKEEFLKIQSDETALIEAVNQSVTETDFYEIKRTLEQIQIHRKNLVDLETKAADFGGNPPPEDNRRMERESRSILEKVKKLETLLSRVYKVRTT